MTEAKRRCDRASSRRRSGIGQRRHSKSRNPNADQIAIERACNGEAVRLTQTELTAAVARLRSAGCSILHTARVLRVAPRTVNRHWVKWREMTGAAA